MAIDFNGKPEGKELMRQTLARLNDLNREAPHPPNAAAPTLHLEPIYPSGVFVELIDGRPVVSIRCADNVNLDELTALARRIMAAIG